MLGLLGWLFFAGAGIKQAADYQDAASRSHSDAKNSGKLYYTNVQGQYFLTETGEKLRRDGRSFYDMRGNLLFNLDTIERDKIMLEARARAQEKAKELGITDRDWLYVKSELGWNPYLVNTYFADPNDERVDLNTGKHWGVGVHSDVLCNPDNSLYDPRKGKATCLVMASVCPAGRDKVANKFLYKRYPVISFWKYYVHDGDNRCIEKQLQNGTNYFLSTGDEISLTDYLLKYKGKLDKSLMNFLLQTDVIRTSKLQYIVTRRDGKKCYDEITINAKPVRPIDKYRLWTDTEDIISINEEKLKEMVDEMNKLPINDVGMSDRDNDKYEYKLKY